MGSPSTECWDGAHMHPQATKHRKRKRKKWNLCDVKGGNLNYDRTHGFGFGCVNRLSVTALHNGCMELHGFSFELCVGMGMAACIDEVRLMRMASRRTENRMGMTLKILGKLLEEATEV